MTQLLPNSDFTAGLAIGAAASVVLVVLAPVALFTLGSAGGLYDLDHWKLNLRPPQQSMWMNLGYWKSQKNKRSIVDFELACTSLLQKVLTTAGLLDVLFDPNPQSPIAILDLGIGCGDQTMHLACQINSARRLRYVGLTLNETQLQTTSRRLGRFQVLKKNDDSKTNIQVFRADAANPQNWSKEVKDAVGALVDQKAAAEGVAEERWMLALDCLYHFSPSRRPILSYAAEQLGANFAAFDLFLDEKASWSNVLLARTVGVLMGCPWKTFLTEDEYQEQLVACGFKKSSIKLEDVSENVFWPLVKYLDRQDQALAEYGISLGPGFRLAKKVFAWFASSGVVRAMIVVAHADRT